jgi:hypothetical protein
MADMENAVMLPRSDCSIQQMSAIFRSNKMLKSTPIHLIDISNTFFFMNL